MNSNNQTIGPLQTAASLGGTGSGTPAIKLTGALTILQTNVSTSFAGVISGAGGSLTINTAAGGAPGTLTLTAVNTYTGPTTINGATLALSGSGSIASSTGISIGAGGTFDVSAFSSSTYSFASVAPLALTFGGTGTTIGSTAATINGASGGIIDLSSAGVSLKFTPTAFTGDATHPALYVSQGTLNWWGAVSHRAAEGKIGS
jgi:autotransporter-associated beta strand protein